MVLNGRYTIENVVASAFLHQTLDLERMVRVGDNCKYNPEEFPEAICKLKRPKVGVLLFGSGKIICAGAKSETNIAKGITYVK